MAKEEKNGSEKINCSQSSAGNLKKQKEKKPA
jgi:hypothetical protein